MCIFCRATEEQIIEYGKAFGYPSCCIEEFVRDTDILHATGKDIRNEWQKEIARSTYGFVPCKKHAAMIAHGKITAEDIVSVTRDEKRANELNAIADAENDF